jgi:hypothetical protein
MLGDALVVPVLELGGSNDVRDLFLEPCFGPYNAHDKDRLEDYLHRQVETGAMSLAEAQTEISGNLWVWSYRHYSGRPPSDHPPATT